MKATLLAATLLLAFLGCTSPETHELSPQDKNRIINEVKAVADTIWVKWEQLDPEAALHYYSESSDWLSINSQGSPYNLLTYRRLASEFKRSATAYKWITDRRDFNVLSTNIVLCNWIGKDEATWKSGDKVTCNPPAYTLIFKKISGHWKLVHSHDSGVWATQKARKQ
jgi:hypothetical protein